MSENTLDRLEQEIPGFAPLRAGFGRVIPSGLTILCRTLWSAL